MSDVRLWSSEDAHNSSERNFSEIEISTTTANYNAESPTNTYL